MMTWNHYYVAKNVLDALEALSHASGEARLIGGGSDLLLELQQGLRPPVDTLVDVTAIPEMNLIEVRQDSLFIGAAVPLNRVLQSPLVIEHAQALYEAACLIGGPQVRNTATLGGNVAHALPAADGTIALLALGAQAQVASLSGRRMALMEDLFLGPARSALDPTGEMLVGFYLPLQSANQGSAFRRVMRPQGVAIAILNMGIWLERAGDCIVEARIAVGPGGPKPFRARGAERLFRDKVYCRENLELALNALQEEARFRSSPHRATTSYRRQLARVLFEDTMASAWDRAAPGGQGSDLDD